MFIGLSGDFSVGCEKITEKFPKKNILVITEICGGLAEMVFYVFAKERWVGEAEQVANLLDAVVGLLQVVADVLKHVLGDPFVGGLSRMLLAECREIFGRDTQFGGIPLYGAVLHVDGVQEVKEALEVRVVCVCIDRHVIAQHSLFQGSAKSEDSSTEQRLEAHLNIVIVGKRLECDLFLVHCMFDFECKGTHFKQKIVF